MSRILPEIFVSPCRAAAAKVQDFDAQGLANALWAMADTCLRTWFSISIPSPSSAEERDSYDSLVGLLGLAGLW